jgi:hypothetical protein
VLADLAALCAHLCDVDQAGQLSQHLWPYRGYVILMGGHLCIGPADRFLGMLAHATGRFDEAFGHYTTALELEQRLKAAPLTARTRYWYGRTLLSRCAPGDETQALSLLQAALATSRALGMTGLAADVQKLLARGLDDSPRG